MKDAAVGRQLHLLNYVVKRGVLGRHVAHRPLSEGSETRGLLDRQHTVLVGRGRRASRPRARKKRLMISARSRRLCVTCAFLIAKARPPRRNGVGKMPTILPARTPALHEAVVCLSGPCLRHRREPVGGPRARGWPIWGTRCPTTRTQPHPATSLILTGSAPVCSHAISAERSFETWLR